MQPAPGSIKKEIQTGVKNDEIAKEKPSAFPVVSSDAAKLRSLSNDELPEIRLGGQYTRKDAQRDKYFVEETAKILKKNTSLTCLQSSGFLRMMCCGQEL